MLRYCFLIYLFISLSYVGRGSTIVTQPKTKAIVHNDTAAVSIRHFDKAVLNNYASQKEFQYGNNYVGESWWSKFWRWFWSLFDIGDQRTAWGIFAVVLKYTFIALGVAALVFLIMKLIGVDAFNVIRRKSQSAALPYEESVENIYAVDLDAEIQKAIDQQNYRFAVRLLYLRLLKQLSDAGRIDWDITKTNSIYIDELTDAEQRLAFKVLTRQFEYVWYGEFAIDVLVFKRISALFTNFKIKSA